MHWGLRAGLVLVALTWTLAACGNDPEPADAAAWAAGVCTAGQKFADAIIESRDVRDPSTLDLPERKERAARLGRIEADAARQLADELDAIEPPEAASEFHDALISRANELAKAIDTQVEAIEKATTAQQIAVANASAKFELQGSNTEVTAKAADVPQELMDALGSQEACGTVPVPGQPTTVIPTPAV